MQEQNAFELRNGGQNDGQNGGRNHEHPTTLSRSQARAPSRLQVDAGLCAAGCVCDIIFKCKNRSTIYGITRDEMRQTPKIATPPRNKNPELWYILFSHIETNCFFLVNFVFTIV